MAVAGPGPGPGPVRVDREVTIVATPVGGYQRDLKQRPSSSVYIPRTGGYGGSPRGRVSRIRSASSILDDIVRHPDVSKASLQEKQLGERDRRDDVDDLVDFLRNKTPPPGNYMSAPEEHFRRDKRKWASKFRVFRRRSLSPQRRHIQLPDSAIAGTTTGGHRHIAISIPLQYTPFSQSSPSQYPVYQPTRAVPQAEIPRNPIRTFVNNTGSVTVLRTVAEDRESPKEAGAADLIPPRIGPVDLYGAAPISPPPSVANSGDGPCRDYFSIPPSPAPTPARGCGTPKDDGRADLAQEMPRTTDGGAGARSAMRVPPKAPLRIERIVANGGVSPLPSPASERGSLAPFSESRHMESRRHRTRLSGQSITESLVTIGSEPVVSDAQAAQGYSSVPIVTRESSLQENSRMRPETSDGPGITVISENPLRFTSAPPPPGPRKTRREKVVERKKRDVGASMALREKRRSAMGPPLNLPQTPPLDANLSFEHRDSESSADLPPLQLPCDTSPAPALVPTVEINDEDASGIENRAPSRAPSHDVLVTPKSSAAPVSAPSSGPTPPQSPSPSGSVGSPSPKIPLDRTSLARRREWNASRERERRDREARASAKAKANKLAGNREPRVSNAAAAGLSKRDLLERYESMKELRMRDAEKRLRRLERNGDVWMNALVPLLETLNRTLLTMQEDQCRGRGRTRGWATDNEDEDEDKNGNDAAADQRILRRQNGAVQDRFLAELARTRDAIMNGFARSDSSESFDTQQTGTASSGLSAGAGGMDVSGLDTIEPLMRELAGTAQLTLDAYAGRDSSEEEEHFVEF